MPDIIFRELSMIILLYGLGMSICYDIKGVFRKVIFGLLLTIPTIYGVYYTILNNLYDMGIGIIING